MVVLLADGPQLGEDGLVEVVEKQGRFGDLLLLCAMEGVGHVAGLILDVLEGECEVGFDLVETLGDGFEKAFLNSG